MNFDDLGISHRDQSRSASFPRIRFANSGEDEDEEDDDDSSYDESAEESDSDVSTAADPSEVRGRAAKSIAIPPKSSTSITGTTADEEGVQKILYIQMEFVDKVGSGDNLAAYSKLICLSQQTLREAISNGLTDEEVWRLLTQILQALSYLSTSKVVHRGEPTH
jgi:translation initiation factor 2-alpha kinase 4